MPALRVCLHRVQPAEAGARNLLAAVHAHLREQRKHGLGLFAEARYAHAVHLRPWQCRCGTWLQAIAWSFGWVDLAGIAGLR